MIVGIIIILLCLFYGYWIYQKINKKKRKIYFEKLFELKDPFIKEYDNFKKQKTILIFYFEEEEEIDDFYIKLMWNQKIYNINKNEKELKIEYIQNKEIKSEIIREQIELNNNKNLVYSINIYSNQKNIYYIFKSKNQNKKYFSIECIMISKFNYLIPKKITIPFKNKIVISKFDTYDFKNRKRLNLINLEENIFVNLIKNICQINYFNLENIKEHKNEFLLNLIYSDKKIYRCIYINNKELSNDSYLYTEKEIKTLLRFKKEYINKCIKCINEKILKGYINEIDNLFKNENINPKEMIKKFYKISIIERYKNKIISKQEIKLIKALCYLTIFKYCKIFPDVMNSFKNLINKIKKETKNDKDFNNFDKLKLLTTSLSLVLNNSNHKYEFYKIKNLPISSPYIQSELFFRKIILNLNENSLLSFMFLQLNSGSEYDYFHNDFCYKITMLSLLDIKKDFLNDLPSYYFTYKDPYSDEYAFVCNFSKIIIFNESTIFNLKNSNINPSYSDNKDYIVKLTLLKFHEKSHNKYFGNYKMQFSPRNYINYKYELQSQNTYIKNNNNVPLNYLIKYLNNDFNKQPGESGRCTEQFLYEGNDIISDALFECENLEELIDYNLFIQENMKELNKKIKQIIKNNKIEIDIKKSIIYPFSNKNKYILNQNIEEEKVNKNKEKEIKNYTVDLSMKPECGNYLDLIGVNHCKQKINNLYNNLD